MSLSHYQNEFDKMMNRDYFSDAVHPMRKEAFSKFFNSGFPTNKWENWRFTNLSKLKQGKYRISETQDAPAGDVDLSSFEIDGVDTVVIYNGHYQETLSSVPSGIQLLSGIEYLERKNWEFETTERSPFDLLNTALMDSGTSFMVDPDTNVETPVRILFISNGEDSLMVNPRIHLDVGESSSVTFIEHHVGNALSFFQNASLLATVGTNASLDHIRIQSNSSSTQNMANLNVKQKSDSRYVFFQFTQGSELGRTNMNVHLNGQGANCTLNGLALSHNKQHLGNHIIVDHHVPHCTSSQLFKSILREKSSGVFIGRTIVQKDAQKTDANQSNKNLLLSKNALMNSNPQLEIRADDVRCSHGSTTGELDADALFYLRSRCLDLETAKSLLVRGFAAELFDTVKDENVKSFLMDCFDNWLEKSDLS